MGLFGISVKWRLLICVRQALYHQWRMWESNPSFSLQMKCAAHHTPSPMNCLHCKIEFTPPLREVKRGNGKFCSLKCSSSYAAQQRANALPRNATCALCGIAFRKSPSKLATAEQHFCCREHKDIAQKRVNGIIILPHYGTGMARYRSLALDLYGAKCNRCGFDRHEAALDVHHKDRNRLNNDPSNLEVLCRNCHGIEHYTNC